MSQKLIFYNRITLSSLSLSIFEKTMMTDAISAYMAIDIKVATSRKDCVDIALAIQRLNMLSNGRIRTFDIALRVDSIP